ncbi:mevalonate kinase [Levilactobacillus senmaizukei DSM 21775 = NBRC 103853]|uniref:Mevalonate kinase n=1 Tax=Levilactobacillus senmaizukei DSM 21775 = NBRC 103853 TaxID=1423803 RepID=A0A0R2DE15_9LACO|nr:mevalonate kinase [Levilactobacillus senmaizukei DSM 21775 = NBRC 103853]
MALKRTVTGTSNAKIILIGEHSVVYHQPAIALPLPSVTTRVTLTKTDAGQQLHSRYFDGPLTEMGQNLSGTAKLIQTLLNRFDATAVPFEMTITSDLPAERGMGSSAAVAVAVTRAMYQFFDRPLNREQLLTTAAIAEKITHGHPSGIDAATVSSHDPIWFIPGHESLQIPFNLPGYLVIADSGVKGQTGKAVAAVARRKTTMPQTTTDQIETLGHLTTETRSTLASADLDRLGTILTAAQHELKGLGVSSPELDKLTHVACVNGALGAKLTGGGMGGCLIALCADWETTQRVQQALTDAGATQAWIEAFETEEEH